MFSPALSLRPLRAVVCLLALGLALNLSSALPAAAQTPTVTALYAFTGGADGGVPNGALIQASDGNFYGTCYTGGTNGNGTIFKIDPAGNFKLFYAFTGHSDGGKPFAGLVQASDGNLYGTCWISGPNEYGTLFRIDLAGDFTLMHTFSDFNEYFSYPNGLIQASDGNLYGTTVYGGAHNSGSIYKIDMAGSFATLYSFSADDYENGPPYDANTDGAVPLAGLVQASDGNLYGTADVGGAYGYGSIFKIDLAGNFTLLHAFTGGADGGSPQAGLMQASDGNLYGTAVGGGNGYGTLFKVDLAGNFTLLHSFTGTDGAVPAAGLMQASDGNLYGTTGYTLFKIDLAGNLTSLYSFNLNTDGRGPQAALIQASDGNLYGTCIDGGAHGYGTVFRFSGAYSQPGLLSISPTSRDAGSTAFTLTVKGSNFQPFSTVNWNGSPLTTTYVSATELKATVPSSLIASPGKASVTVVTGAGGGSSKAKTFTVLLTTLKLASVSLTQNSDGSYTANLTLKNEGYNTASNVTLTKATLGTAATSTPLPLALGSISVGSSGNVALNFPSSAGSPGTVVTLKVSGTFSGGTFSGSVKVKLP